MSTFAWFAWTFIVLLAGFSIVVFSIAINSKDYDNDLSRDHETL